MDYGTVLETPTLHSWLYITTATATILHVHFFVHFFVVTARIERIIQPKGENPGNEVA